MLDGEECDDVLEIRRRQLTPELGDSIARADKRACGYFDAACSWGALCTRHVRFSPPLEALFSAAMRRPLLAKEKLPQPGRGRK
jgi:hypothetical protein